MKSEFDRTCALRRKLRAIFAKLLSVSSRLHFNSFYLFWEIIFIWNTNLQSTYRQILGWNKPILRQAPLPGGKPACGRFPWLVLFHLSALPIERLKISISIKLKQGKKRHSPWWFLRGFVKGKHSSLPWTPIPYRFLSPHILLAAGDRTPFICLYLFL